MMTKGGVTDSHRSRSFRADRAHGMGRGMLTRRNAASECLSDRRHDAISGSLICCMVYRKPRHAYDPPSSDARPTAPACCLTRCGRHSAMIPDLSGISITPGHAQSHPVVAHQVAKLIARTEVPLQDAVARQLVKAVRLNAFFLQPGLKATEAAPGRLPAAAMLEVYCRALQVFDAHAPRWPHCRQPQVQY